MRVIIIVFSFFLCAYCYSESINQNCLEFVEGINQNKVIDFLEKNNRHRNIKNSSKFYSASYDLNSDGNPEFFYFFETYWSCGTSTGCNLMLYEYRDGEFIKLIDRSLYPRDAFNPKLDSHKHYVCIKDDLDGSWKRLNINNRFEMKYLDKYYQTITKKE